MNVVDLLIDARSIIEGQPYLVMKAHCNHEGTAFCAEGAVLKALGAEFRETSQRGNSYYSPIVDDGLLTMRPEYVQAMSYLDEAVAPGFRNIVAFNDYADGKKSTSRMDVVAAFDRAIELAKADQ